MAAFLKENFSLICLLVGILGVLIGIVSLFFEMKKRKKNKTGMMGDL